MLIRARFPDGSTVRVSMEHAAGTAAAQMLRAKISSFGRVEDPFTLHVGPSSNSPPFVIDQASHGDIVFVHGKSVIDVDEEAIAAERSAAIAATFAADSARRTAQKLEQKTSEASFSNKLESQRQDHTDVKDNDGTDILKNSSRTESAEEKDKEWRPRCMHGPRGMCEHCMPSEDKKSRYERELAKWKGKGMSIGVMEALEALRVTVRPQENAHISAAVIDNAAAAEFQAYLAKTSFSQQRIGICYGRYNSVENETQVLAIYEPPQRGSESTYVVVKGDESGDVTNRAAKLACLLGLDCVGLVISARPRKCILSGKDVVVAAEYLSALSPELRKSFIILLVCETESGETSFEAYQLSDQAVEIFEQGGFAPEEDQKANGGRVFMKENVLVEGKETTKVHTEFFILNIPIKSMDGEFRTQFPVENRELQPQTPSDVKKAVDPSSGLTYGTRLADFHLLLFLSVFLDIDSDMPSITQHVKAGSEDIEEGYRILIDSMGP